MSTEENTATNSPAKPTTTLVMYTDAGARPTNPGYGGWGAHGYMCVPKVSKQGNGHNTHHLSVSGYVQKNVAKVTEDEKFKDTDVLCYYDCVGTLGPNVGNNYGELKATNHALQLALQEQPDQVLIRSDSMYVIDSANKHAVKWQQNDWKRPDGTEYKYAQTWAEHLRLRSQLEEQGTKVEYSWVRGHAGEPGNTLADTYATIGVLASMQNVSFTDVSKTDAKGYWKYDMGRPPLLDHSKLYFVGHKEANVKGVYYCGNHGKDDEMIGVQCVDAQYSVVRLTEPDTLIEELRGYAIELSDERGDTTPPFYYMTLGAVFNPKFHQVAAKFGKNALYPYAPHHNSMRSVVPIKLEEEDDVTVTEDENGKVLDKSKVIAKVKKKTAPNVITDVKPYMLSWRVIDQMEILEKLLDAFESGSSELTHTDITDVLYESSEVKGKTVTKMRDKFKTNFKRLEVNANYNVSGTVDQTNIYLITPSDLPVRNVLKRIETQHPKVTVITWRESDVAFRYATVIQIDGAIGIWCGAFSNIRYLLKPLTEVAQDK